MSWKIENSWLFKDFFNKMLPSFQINISQLWWHRWGLEFGPERARTETPVQFTDGHNIPTGPSMAMVIRMLLWPTMIQWWSIADNEKIIGEKFVQVENWHVHVVKMKVKSHERQMSAKQETLGKSNEMAGHDRKSGLKRSADKTNAARTRQ